MIEQRTNIKFSGSYLINFRFSLIYDNFVIRFFFCVKDEMYWILLKIITSDMSEQVSNPLVEMKLHKSGGKTSMCVPHAMIIPQPHALW